MLLAISTSKTVAKALVAAVVEPILELQAAAKKLTAGELDIEITYDGQDEIGELAHSLLVWKKWLQDLYWKRNKIQ